MNSDEQLLLCVEPQVIGRVGKLASEFDSAQPFRHVVVDDFFSPAFCRELANNFPPFDDSLAINEDGIVGNKAVHENIPQLGPAWETLDRLVQSETFRDLISKITGIADLRHDPHYFGGGTHENRQGQGLDAHIDFNFHPITREHRRLNLIVYLNEEWQDDWGGVIRLHKNPYLPTDQDQIVSISPKFNRCVIFETNEKSWHGFPRINLPEDKRSLSRRSFALYYYTEKRPPDETGPEHSTIYVDGHLSDKIQAGSVLDEGQLQEVRTLLAGRDQHIKRLYENIKQLTKDVNKLNAIRSYHEEQQTELEFLRDEFQKQRSEILQKKEEVASQHDEITSLRDQLQDSSGRLHDLSGQLQEIKDSSSWRITGPLRTLKRVFNKSP